MQDIQPSDQIMLAMSVPYAPISLARTSLTGTSPTGDGLSAAIVVNTNSVTFHDCQQIGLDSPEKSTERIIDPASSLMLHLAWSGSGSSSISTISTVLLDKPSHGSISEQIDKTGHHYYVYDPLLGYLGPDQVTFLVAAHGKTYRIVQQLIVVKVFEDGDNAGEVDPCLNPSLIKSETLWQVPLNFGLSDITITF